MIRVINLTKEYEKITPVKNLNVTINDGEIISIIGHSGCGKSTFLRCLNLLEKPTSGEIYYNDLLVNGSKESELEIKKHMGMVFQSFNLFNHLTVVENIMAPQIDILHRTKQEAYNRAIELLKTVGLLDKKNEYPKNLSGGQKQRVSIARTLAMDCETILFDEPTSALDPTMVNEVEAVIKSLARTNKTLIIVSHDMRFVRDVSTRIFFMDNGTIYEDGTPEQIFDHPQKQETRRFIKNLKCKEFNIISRDYDYISMISELGCFAKSQYLSLKSENRIISSFEELIINDLGLRFDYITYIDYSIEYNPNAQSVSIRIEYDGEQYNPLDDKQSISSKLIKSYFKENNYRYDNNKINVIKLKLIDK